MSPCGGICKGCRSGRPCIRFTPNVHSERVLEMLRERRRVREARRADAITRRLFSQIAEGR